MLAQMVLGDRVGQVAIALMFLLWLSSDRFIRGAGPPRLFHRRKHFSLTLTHTLRARTRMRFRLRENGGGEVCDGGDCTTAKCLLVCLRWSPTVTEKGETALRPVALPPARIVSACEHWPLSPHWCHDLSLVMPGRTLPVTVGLESGLKPTQAAYFWKVHTRTRRGGERESVGDHLLLLALRTRVHRTRKPPVP
jgi:hypothetical protein